MNLFEFGVLGLEKLHRLLLRLDPEVAHDTALRGLRTAQGLRGPIRAMARRYRVRDPRLVQQLWGQTFSNPVGLAAGFDKNGQALDALAALGFGFLEAGTITLLPQPGNPKPRMFRYPVEQSLQNSLGFNNLGVARLLESLSQRRVHAVPVGVNVGKNRNTSADAAIGEYVQLVEQLQGSCDYFVINVSSPNTPGLRDLQDQAVIAEMVVRCARVTDKPLLVKLAPDLTDSVLVTVSKAAVEAGAAGIVLTNTTAEHSLLPAARASGGLSGRVLRDRSFEALRVVAKELFGRCILVSVGGIDSTAEAVKRLEAGASLVQVYTGLVFRGPGLVEEIVRGILEHLESSGAKNVTEIIGSNLR